MKDVKLQTTDVYVQLDFKFLQILPSNCYMKGTKFTTLTLPKIVSESGVFDKMISQNIGNFLLDLVF